MRLLTALILYFITFAGTMIVLKKMEYHSFSAFVLSMILSQIVLNIAYPPTNGELSNITSQTSLYFLLQFLGPIIVVVYVLIVALNDYEIDKRDEMNIPRITLETD